MKKFIIKKKSVLVIFLIIAFVFSLIPSNAFASFAFPDDVDIVDPNKEAYDVFKIGFGIERRHMVNAPYAHRTGRYHDESEAEFLVGKAVKIERQYDHYRESYPTAVEFEKFLYDTTSFFKFSQRLADSSPDLAEKYLRTGAEEMAIGMALYTRNMSAGERAFDVIVEGKKNVKNFKTNNQNALRYIKNYDYLILSAEELDYQINKELTRRAAGESNPVGKHNSVLRPFNLRQSEIDRLRRVEQGLEPIFPEIKPNEYVLRKTEEFFHKYKPHNLVLKQNPTSQVQTIENVKPLSERIFVNGKRVSFDVSPVIELGRTLVPIRMVAQELGAEVEWLDATREVVIIKDDKTIILTLGSNKVSVDGKPETIDVPAKAINGRTLVPIRFISETMKYSVSFIEGVQEIRIGN